MSAKDTSANGSPAVAVAKIQSRDEIVTLSTGVQARLTMVPMALITDVVSKIKDPDVPIWHNEEKGRDEPNPNHPTYLRQLAEAEQRRGVASMDAMIMFGVELVNGVPEDEGWIKKLNLLARMGQLDLSPYDLNDPVDKEFLYKRYIAVGLEDLARVGRLSGITPEDVERAEGTF